MPYRPTLEDLSGEGPGLAHHNQCPLVRYGALSAVYGLWFTNLRDFARLTSRPGRRIPKYCP